MERDDWLGMFRRYISIRTHLWMTRVCVSVCVIPTRREHPLAIYDNRSGVRLLVPHSAFRPRPVSIFIMPRVKTRMTQVEFPLKLTIDNLDL